MSEENRYQLEETKKHGSVLFPFNIYPCTIPKDFPSVALHWHKSLEIIFIKKGRGTVQVGLETVIGSAGDIFVLPPGTLHGLRELPGEQMEYENIICEMEFLGSGAADACSRQYLVPLAVGQLLEPVYVQPETPEYESIAACLKVAEYMCEFRERGYELGVKAAMLQLLYLLVSQLPEAPAPEPPGMERLRQVLSRIEREYAKPLTVETMADYCGCSASHFMRWFHQVTGSS